MGKRPRRRPKHLAAKLVAIRQKLELSQSEMAERLGSNATIQRVSAYEVGTREPNLLILLRYARLAGVCLCALIDDDVDIGRRHLPH